MVSPPRVVEKLRGITARTGEDRRANFGKSAADVFFIAGVSRATAPTRAKIGILGKIGFFKNRD